MITIHDDHERGQAPANALALKAILDGSTVPAPHDLFHAFEDQLRGRARPAPPGDALAGESRPGA